MKGNPIMAYKSFRYEIITGSNGKIVKRQMRFLDTENVVDLTAWGEITLNEFKEIVDTYLNTEPV